MTRLHIHWYEAGHLDPSHYPLNSFMHAFKKSQYTTAVMLLSNGHLIVVTIPLIYMYMYMYMYGYEKQIICCG